MDRKFWSRGWNWGRAILCCVASSLALSGCFGSSDEGAKNPNQIEVWHWMTDRQEAFEALAAQYKKETGVEVRFLTFAPSDIYQQKIIAAIQGNLLPDVFGVLSGDKDFASFIKAGHILDLTAQMDSGWKEELFPKAVLHNSFIEGNEWGVKPGVYGVPVDVNDMLVYYNKDLFKKAGLDPENPPKTWTEFIAAGKKLRAAGIQPFVSGFGEAWLVGTFLYSYQWHILGRERMIATIEGRLPYNDPEWVKIFGLYKEMRDAGMFASGMATMINKYAEQVFANQQAAMALNGSWGVNVYHGMNPALNYGVMLPPSVDGAAFPMKIWGGGGSSLVVNARSPRAKAAVDFLRWFTRKEQQLVLAEQTHNIPSNVRCLDQLPPLLKQFADAMDKTWDKLPVVEDWEVITKTNTLLQSIIIGELEPKDMADQLAELKKRKLESKAS